MMRDYGPDGLRREQSGGIGVATRWHEFSTFVEDLGARPTKRHALMRFDRRQGFEPGNVGWRERRKEADTFCRETWLALGGLELPVSRWAERTGLRPNTILTRLRRGWSVEDALTLPVSRTALRHRVRQLRGGTRGAKIGTPPVR